MSKGGKRIQLILLSIVALLAIGVYWSGYEDNGNGMRSGDWVSWPYYRYLISGYIPVVLLVATWITFYDQLRKNPNHWFYFGLIVVSVGWMAMFVGWEVVVWTECSDKTGGVPDHPHCINRNYPLNGNPDPNFFLTFSGGAMSLFLALCYFFFIFADHIFLASRAAQAFQWGMQSKMTDEEDEVPKGSGIGAPITATQAFPLQYAQR